mmetsp:Transcript_7222/g.17419  ORF Transcript_7222/g.17419 Transcript_7222/m.17419 type:complete len:443 (-) Transcript_7222:156-1484(-)
MWVFFSFFFLFSKGQGKPALSLSEESSDHVSLAIPPAAPVVVVVVVVVVSAGSNRSTGRGPAPAGGRRCCCCCCRRRRVAAAAVVVAAAVAAVVVAGVAEGIAHVQGLHRVLDLERILPEAVDDRLVFPVLRPDGVHRDDAVARHAPPPPVSRLADGHRPGGVPARVGLAAVLVDAEGIGRGDAEPAAPGLGRRPEPGLVPQRARWRDRRRHRHRAVDGCLPAALPRRRRFSRTGRFRRRRHGRGGLPVAVVFGRFAAVAVRWVGGFCVDVLLQDQDLPDPLDEFQVAEIVDDRPEEVLGLRGGFFLDPEELHEFFHRDAVPPVGNSKVVRVLQGVVAGFDQDLPVGRCFVVVVVVGGGNGVFSAGRGCFRCFRWLGSGGLSAAVLVGVVAAHGVAKCVSVCVCVCVVVAWCRNRTEQNRTEQNRIGVLALAFVCTGVSKSV